MNIFHLNIHSLHFHKTDLDVLLDALKLDFDIITISESKLRKDIAPVTDISLTNYTYVDTPTEASKGCTLIYVSDRLSYKPRKDLEIYESRKLESTFIEIVNETEQNIIVGCIYRHHNISVKDFTETMATLLSKLSKEKKKCFLAGDFNINLLQLESNTETEQFFDTVTDANFTPLITSPTRISKNTKTLIDNIFYNNSLNDIICGNLTVGISDHMPQFAFVPRNKTKSKTSKHNIKTNYVRKYKDINIEIFNQDLDKINWDTKDFTDVNHYSTNFLHIFNQILDVHAPMVEVKVSKKQAKRNAKPWITTEILKLIKLKDKTYQQLIKEEDTTIKNELKASYNQQKNEITKLIRKSIHFNNYFVKNSKNIKKLWAGINQIINKSNTHNNIPVSIEIDIDGNVNTIVDPKEIANTFNSHYTTVADKILKKRKYSGNKSFNSYLKNPNSLSYMIKPTSPREIEDIISKFDTSKSTGPNSIPQQVIQSIKKSIAIPLSNMFNMSFLEGKCPSMLKISSIIPIFKKDSKLIAANYRPISLLSNINKILEKLMFNRLYKFLESSNCIYNLQFGFRQKHSTNDALLSMTQQINDTIDKGDIAVGVFVDFQKAFDTVNHTILLKKLEHYGVRGIANDWFASYLQNREQYVSIGKVNSDISHIAHGVPQGSVLGPLLFLIYINDLNQCIYFSTVRHFADDTNLLYTVNLSKPRNRNQTRKLNVDLKALNQWLLANKISLNTAKTELIYFRNKKTEIPNWKIKLNGIKLKETNIVKYVGFTFDEHLTFKNHITLLNAKLRRTNNLLAISRHYLAKKFLIQLYYGQFYSHLTYGCQLWGQNENSIKSTITLQKKAVRLISFAQSHDHSSPLFKELNLLKLTDIVKQSNLLFTHNAINNNTPQSSKITLPLLRPITNTTQ